MRTLQMACLVSSVLFLNLARPPILAQGGATGIGIFESDGDVGTVFHPGSAEYDSSKKSYLVSGSGENMWLAADAFHFVWKKISADDVYLAADVSFLGMGGNPHRKAVLMVRQSLDPASPYADVALHGNGLTSLQFREAKGESTHEVQSSTWAPHRLGIRKTGNYLSMWLARNSEQVAMAGGSVRVPLEGAFYIGIGVCSHDKNAVEKALFSNVELKVTEAGASSAGQPTLYSTLETVAVDSTDRRVVYVAPERFEAPNWTRDGFFIFNRKGHIQRLPVAGGTPETIETGFAVRCNNDHGISPDGTLLAISDQSLEEHNSIIFIVSIKGGTPQRITKYSPSYWHGWSPDGNTLAFVGQRNGEFDIYSIPVAGGEEIRLTTAPGLDDGPEYSPDGNYIYFNSVRTGLMQIWRMRPDGSQQEQVFSDEYNNWFPHISPDGKWMVFLTYEKDVMGHPENKDVMLRLMSLGDKRISILAKLFGGQGTINVPSWSPDSRQVAFVSYQLIPAESRP